MKIYISADLEGVGGVTGFEQTGEEGKDDFLRARQYMTAEVNAAIEGALEGGATELVVNDAHSGMRNLIPDRLHPVARLVSGSPKPLGMMEGIEAGFEGAFFLGYHARGGAPGVLNHTYAGRVVSGVRLNGMTVGEVGLNAALAGYLGVPVLLVSGDAEVVREAGELLGEVVGVAVKEPLGQYAARCLHPDRAREAIREGARRALEKRSRIRPFNLGKPVRLEITFTQTGMADLVELMPAVIRQGTLEVSFTHEDYAVIFKAFRAMVALAGTVWKPF